MRSGQKLQIATGGGFTVQFLTEILIQAFGFKLMVFQEPLQVLLVLRAVDCAGTENQCAVRFYILRGIAEDPSLKLYKL